MKTICIILTAMLPALGSADEIKGAEKPPETQSEVGKIITEELPPTGRLEVRRRKTEIGANTMTVMEMYLNHSLIRFDSTEKWGEQLRRRSFDYWLPLSEREAFAQLLGKFLEWARIAEVNNVMSFEKPIGKLSDAGVSFAWFNENNRKGATLMRGKADAPSDSLAGLCPADARLILSFLGELQKPMDDLAKIEARANEEQKLFK